jgi:diguanylate cyclase (GGDEF)-like protein/putative nucleotidyltransferase with HDIG domain
MNSILEFLKRKAGTLWLPAERSIWQRKPSPLGSELDDEEADQLRVPLYGRLYIALVTGVGLLCFYHAVSQMWVLRSDLPWFNWLFLGALTLLVGSHPVRLPGARGTVSVSDTFVFLSIMMLGPNPAAVLGGLDGFFGTTTRSWRSELYKRFFNLSLMSISVWIGGQIYARILAGHGKMIGIALAPNEMLVPVSAMVLLHFLVNSMGVACVVGICLRQSFLKTWKDGFLWTSLSYFAGGSAAAVVYMFVHKYGFPSFAALLPILLITYYTYKIYLERVEDKNKHIKELASVHMSTIESLAMAIDAKDQMTHGHVRRVQAYALELARLLNVRPEELHALKAAALLHDIGKLAVPDYILNKPGKLTATEYQKMKIHPQVGAEILRNVKFPYPVLPIVRHHHERYNGTGYPDGLRTEEIPLGARILAIVDCYEALRANRVYRHRLTRDEAVRVVRESAGTHFDPKIVEVFIENLDQIEEYVTATARRTWPQEATLPLQSSVLQAAVEEESAEAQPSVLNEIASAQKEVFALYEIAQTLGSSLNMTDTLVIIVSKIEKLIPFATCVIYLVDPVTKALVAEYVSGQNAELLKGKQIQLGEGITGAAAAAHRFKFSTNPELDFTGVDAGIAREYSGLVVCPLLHDGQVLGAISLYADESQVYSDDHSRILDIIAKLAAGAIHNARVFEQTQESALTDALTGLPNSRYLHMQFEQELSKAKRYHHSMAVLAMDLEEFKAVNDRLGHYAGDQLLIEISRTLKTQMRGGDTVARYAGDEFIAILPMIERQEAMLMIERLQGAVDKLRFRLPGSSTAVQVGLSIGAAFFPDDGETLETLMIKADRLMYRNKAARKKKRREGQGKVVAFAGKSGR